MISHLFQKIQEGTQPLQSFGRKVSNDWVMSSAASLAYRLINALLPLALVLTSVFGLTVGRLDPATHARLIAKLQNVLPTPLSAQNVLEPALTFLSKGAGIVTFLGLLLAIMSGSRLFMVIESHFGIIYRTSVRKTGAKYGMAVLMLLIFVTLIPLAFLASSIPALLLWLTENTALNHLPGIVQLTRHTFLLDVASILESVIATWLFFTAIYTIVPNQKIPFRRSWKGTLCAALLLEIFSVLFPFYVTHFMGSYTGFIGSLLISLFFFYYFAAILLIGAEVNAFCAEHIPALPDTLVNFVRHEAEKGERVQ